LSVMPGTRLSFFRYRLHSFHFFAVTGRAMIRFFDTSLTSGRITSARAPSIILISLYFILFSLSGAAGEGDKQKPVLLMISMDASIYTNMEIKLQRELALSIDSHTLVVENDFQFTKTTIAERIDEIRKLENAKNCDVAIWITPMDENIASLQMAVLAPGQFTIRSVEVNMENSGIGELSIAIRELLRDIRIPLDTMPGTQPSRKSSRREAKSGAPPQTSPGQSPSTSNKSRYFLSVDMGVESGFQRITSPPLVFTGAIGLGLTHSSGFQLGTIFHFFNALPFGPSNTDIKTFGFRPGVQFRFLWRMKNLSLGPFLSILAAYQKTRIAQGEAILHKENWWNCTVEPGLLLLFPAGKSVQFLIRSAVGVDLRQIIVKQTSDESILYKPPRLTGRISAGINFMFP
jgi:hypothetical protein